MKKGFLKLKFLVEGVNIKYIPQYLKSNKISLLKYNFINENQANIVIDYTDRRKFFAISKNMCYNIKNNGCEGLFSPMYILLKNIGITIGFIFFICLTYLFNGYILSIDCVGSGSCFSSHIIEIANKNNVRIGSKFSDIDKTLLKTEILKSNKSISFVSIEKRGNRLIINTALSDKNDGVLSKNDSDIISNVKGVVESISVLRGTAIVKSGDIVNEGSLLVGAYITDKDGNTYPTYVVCRVVILEEKQKFFKSNNVDEAYIKNAIKTAEFLEDEEVVSSKGQKCDGGVMVTLKVRHVISY